jgi:hypothetical protein
MAERCLKTAGMNVIPAKNYYLKHHGNCYKVSEWEEHPSVEGHKIFADSFIKEIKKNKLLQKYKK